MSSTRFPRILPCCEYAHVLINSTDCFPKQPPFLYSTTCPQPVWNCSLEQRPWVWNNKEGESHLEGGKWKHTWAASEVSTHGFVLKNYGWQGSYFSVSSKCTFSIPTTAKHERPPNARSCYKRQQEVQDTRVNSQALKQGQQHLQMLPVGEQLEALCWPWRGDKLRGGKWGNRCHHVHCCELQKYCQTSPTQQNHKMRETEEREVRLRAVFYSRENSKKTTQ